jgi:UrcA family protein
MSQYMKYALAAAAVTLSTWQGSALADPLNTETQSITVRFADLDLNQPQDIRVLYRRINLAAGIACGESKQTGSNLPLPSWQHCVAGAVDAAVLQLDRPALTAYHRAHTSDTAWKG